MASHPYISGAGNLTQIVNLLRRNFPATITSETIKKYGVASNNESYVINALQFIGVINEEGKRTPRGEEVFSQHGEEAFQKAFDRLVRDAYKDLFELRGDDAWTLSKDDLIGFFRATDKTSGIIGTRQAAVFSAFGALAGHDAAIAGTKDKAASKSKGRATPAPRTPKVKMGPSVVEAKSDRGSAAVPATARELALTVRIEINLPANGTRENYDSIFQSIRATLLDD